MNARIEASPAAHGAPRDVRAVLRALRSGRCCALRPALPYVSLVLVATDHDGAPMLLLSDLADHTRNLAAIRAPRCCSTARRAGGPAGRRAGHRAGPAAREREPRHRARYLARHRSAAMYVDFKDFAFYRMEVERAHLVAGFGRIHWLDGAEVLVEAGARS